MVKGFSWIPKCKNLVHTVQPYLVSLKFRMRNHPKLQGCFIGMSLIPSPDLRCRNVLKTFEMAIWHNRRTTWTELEGVFCRWIYFRLRSKIFFLPSYGGGGRSPPSPYGSATGFVCDKRDHSVTNDLHTSHDEFRCNGVQPVYRGAAIRYAISCLAGMTTALRPRPKIFVLDVEDSPRGPHSCHLVVGLQVKCYIKNTNYRGLHSRCQAKGAQCSNNWNFHITDIGLISSTFYTTMKTDKRCWPVVSRCVQEIHGRTAVVLEALLYRRRTARRC